MSDKLGDILDNVQRLRIVKSELEAQAKAVEGEISAYKDTILEQMQIEGLQSLKSDTASCYIKQMIVGNVVDIAAFLQYIEQTGDIGLIQPRVNNAAYAESIEHDTQIPGVEPFNKITLQVRKI